MDAEVTDRGPCVFSLTELTGKKSSGNRRVVIQGFDISWRVALIVAVGFVPAVILTAVAWMFLSQMALFTIPVFYVAVFYLIEGRSRDGLKLRRYQALRDKRKATTGSFYLCGRAIDPAHPATRVLKSTTVARDTTQAGVAVADLFEDGADPRDPYGTPAIRPSRRELKGNRAAAAEQQRAAHRDSFERAKARREAEKADARQRRAAEAAHRRSRRPAPPTHTTLGADQVGDLFADAFTSPQGPDR